MASDATAPATVQPRDDSLTPFWAIAWGGAMLIVLALWLRAKFEDLTVVLIVGVALLGAGSLLFAAWQLIGALRQTATPERAARRNKEAGAICMVAGFAMLCLAVALGYNERLASFGEAVGLALFGLAAMVYGRALLRPAPVDPTQLWTGIRDKLGIIKLAMVVLGGGSILALLVIGFRLENRSVAFPELAALFTGGVFLLFAVFWLQLQSVHGELKLERLRIFVLVVGGVSGLIISIMILWRMFMWRDQVFLGGLEVWLGEGFWRFWLCAYVLLGGLGLMFGSLLLARADIHENIVLRRSLYGSNAIFTGVLVLAILILANVLFYILVPYTINWTRTSFTTLSPSTKNLLAKIKEPVTFYVLMSEGHPATNDLRILLENSQIENARIDVKHISPEAEPKKYLELAERFKELQPEKSLFGVSLKRGVLIVYGPVPSDRNQPLPKYAFVTEDKIFESKMDDPHMPPQMRKGKRTNVFKAEPEIMKELHHLSAGQQKRKLYVLQGNGELDINIQDVAARTFSGPLSQFGIGKLVERLKKEEFEVQGLRFTARLKEKENIIVAPEVGPDKKKEIPDDAYAVMIPGPSEPISQEILDALERYLDKGGRLVAFFDTVFDEKYTRLQTSGLEDFLKKYGVEVKAEYAIMPELRDLRVSIATTPDRSESILAKQFAKTAMGWYAARTVKPLPSTGRFKADVLFHLDAKTENFWTETSPLPFSDLGAYVRDVRANQPSYVARILQDSLPVAATVTEGTGELAKPRMVVFGDADFIINADRSPAVFHDLVVGSLQWMAERGGGFIAPRAREQATYNAPLSVDGTRLFVYPGLLMLLCVAGLGAGLWLVRRR